MSNYRAGLVDDFATWCTRMYVARDVHDGTEYLLETGDWERVPHGEVMPSNAGLVLPNDALPAIAEAFHPLASHAVEVTRLEEALTLERERVDSVLLRLWSNTDPGETP